MAFHLRIFWTVTLLPAAGLFAAWAQTAGAPSTAPVSSKPVAVVASVPAAAVAASGESTQGAMQVLDLLGSLSRFDQNGRAAEHKVGFELPERAVNEYLAYALRTSPRPGITALTVALLAGNEVAATVEIDFDAVQQWNPEILPKALRPEFKGKQTIKITGHFQSAGGSATFTLKEGRDAKGNLISNSVMTSLLQAIGSRQPESFDPARATPLPFGLKRVWTQKQSLCGET